MTPVKWVVVALFLLGMVWPPLLLAALVIYEFGVRRGADAVAVWLEGRFGGRRAGHHNGN